MTTPNYYFFWNGPCSQWAESPFTEFGIEFNCTEQFMMAAKAQVFGDTESYDKIMATSMPNEQKKIGRGVKNFEPGKWNDVAMDYVTLGNYNKFSQHQPSADFLKEHSDRVFVEASPYDKVWGIGMKEGDDGINDADNWQGENKLGVCINAAQLMIEKGNPAHLKSLRNALNWTK